MPPRFFIKRTDSVKASGTAGGGESGFCLGGIVTRQLAERSRCRVLLYGNDGANEPNARSTLSIYETMADSRVEKQFGRVFFRLVTALSIYESINSRGKDRRNHAIIIQV